MSESTPFLFPDCNLIDCEQRSEAWFEARRGILTASNFGPWLIKSDATSRKAREGHICKLLASAAECWEPKSYESEEMQRGTDLEPEAVASFEAWSGKKVEPIGFCRSKHGLFGCSPDGLIVGEPAGFEGKAPLPSSHIGYRRAGVLPEQYRFQVHGSMAVTGAREWWFQSYNPGLANFRILVERDQFTDELHAALKEFSRDLAQALEDERIAWELEFRKEVE